jgi:predicted MFS family arabinose efflux permease
MVLLVNLARVVFAPLLEPLQTQFGVSATAIGLLATLAWLGSALPRLPTGYLLTRVPRHAVIVVAGALLTISPIFAATASSLRVLWASAFVMGISSGMYFIAAKPLLSDLFPQRIGGAVGLHGTASQLASAGAPLFVTIVLFVSGWQVVFYLVSATAAVATLAFVMVTRRSDVPTGEAEDRDFLGAARREWPVILSGIVLAGFAGLAWNGVFNFYVSYLITAKAIPESTARVLLSVAFAAGVIAFTVTGRLADRVAYIPLLLSIVGVFAGCVFAVTMATGLLQLTVVSIALGFMIYSLMPTIDTYVLDSLPDARRASAYAVFSASFMLLNALGSVIVGVLLDAGYTYATIFQLFGVCMLMVTIVLAGVHRTIGFPAGRRSRQNPDVGSRTTPKKETDSCD